MTDQDHRGTDPGNPKMSERDDLDETPAATPHGDQDEGVHEGPTPQPAHDEQDQGLHENPRG
jgi:hypothetical protein